MNALAVVVVVVKHEQIFASVINSAICSLAPYACFDHLGNPQWLVNSNLKWILEKKPCQIETVSVYVPLLPSFHSFFPTVQTHAHFFLFPFGFSQCVFAFDSAPFMERAFSRLVLREWLKQERDLASNRRPSISQGRRVAFLCRVQRQNGRRQYTAAETKKPATEEAASSESAPRIR